LAAVAVETTYSHTNPCSRSSLQETLKSYRLSTTTVIMK